MSNARKFAQWLDHFERSQPEKKFASIEHALDYFEAMENRNVGSYGERLDDLVNKLKTNNVQSVGGDSSNQLALEVMAQAMERQGGEYLYIAYVPDLEGSHVIDMGLKGGKNLPGVLLNFSCNGHIKAVNDFIRLGAYVVNNGARIIATEHIKRSKNN